MPSAHITADFVVKVPNNKSGQTIFWDTKLKGFGLLVGKERKSFVFQRDVAGRAVRTTIGRVGDVQIGVARAEAERLKPRMRDGHNPNAGTESLAEALDAYIDRCAKKGRAASTQAHYKFNVTQHLKTWLGLDLKNITPQMVRRRHVDLTAQLGAFAANATMRALRAVFRHARKRYPLLLPIVPTDAIDWNPEHARKDPIPDDMLRAWYAEVMRMQNPVRRDFHLLCLLTGMRKTSVATIKWADITDLDGRKPVLHVPLPKGGSKKAFSIPLSTAMVVILNRRREENQPLYPGSEYVFPANGKKCFYLTAVRVPLTEVGQSRLHSLRHTFRTAASDAGVDTLRAKLLMNHELPQGDMSARYLSASAEALRPDQQKITDHLLALLDPDGGKVVKFKRATP